MQANHAVPKIGNEKGKIKCSNDSQLERLIELAKIKISKAKKRKQYYNEKNIICKGDGGQVLLKAHSVTSKVKNKIRKITQSMKIYFECLKSDEVQ